MAGRKRNGGKQCNKTFLVAKNLKKRRPSVYKGQKKWRRSSLNLSQTRNTSVFQGQRRWRRSSLAQKKRLSVFQGRRRSSIASTPKGASVAQAQLRRSSVNGSSSCVPKRGRKRKQQGQAAQPCAKKTRSESSSETTEDEADDSVAEVPSPSTTSTPVPAASTEVVSSPEGEERWNDFQRRHVVDPTLALGMSRAEWNTWLYNRLSSETNERQRYGVKNINTVVADTPERLLANFQNSNFRLGSGGNYFWTSYAVRTFDLRLTANNGYNVFYCGDRHIAAGMIENRPVHLHRHFQSRPVTGNVQSTVKGCNQVS